MAPRKRRSKKTPSDEAPATKGANAADEASDGVPIWFVPGVVTIASYSLYAATASRSVGGGDSGEHLAEACLGGVAHPPGYGLYLSLLSGAAALRPAASPAAAGALASAACGAVAAGALAAAAEVWVRATRLSRHAPVASLVAGAAFATSPLAWEYSTHAEVFALNNMIVALGLAATASVAASGSEAAAFGGALLVGAAAAHQQAALLTAGPLAACALAWLPRRAKLALPLAATAAAVLGAFACDLRRRSAAPVAGGWGDLGTATGLARHLSRAEYGTFSLGANGGGGGGDADGAGPAAPFSLVDFGLLSHSRIP